ncbi:hypothetical protein KFK09_013830 [Dendrobium nobile]|uniref:Uncharacterized protein n=1 Tax=Dendrobium nobile TaxID=94219 RepID=A0A8T3BAU2_DENNO|nr:hypothetical protein KFK09_013830 [Dendrobium nobile]
MGDAPSVLEALGSVVANTEVVLAALPSVESPGCTLADGDSPAPLVGVDVLPGNQVGFSPTDILVPGIGDVVGSCPVLVHLEPAPSLLPSIDGGLVNVDSLVCVLEDCVRVQNVVEPVESIEMGGRVENSVVQGMLIKSHNLVNVPVNVMALQALMHQVNVNSGVDVRSHDDLLHFSSKDESDYDSLSEF